MHERRIWHNLAIVWLVLVAACGQTLRTEERRSGGLDAGFDGYDRGDDATADSAPLVLSVDSGGEGGTTDADGGVGVPPTWSNPTSYDLIWDTGERNRLDIRSVNGGYEAVLDGVALEVAIASSALVLTGAIKILELCWEGSFESSSTWDEFALPFGPQGELLGTFSAKGHGWTGGTSEYKFSGAGSVVADTTPPVVEEMIAEEHSPDKELVLPWTAIAISLSEGVRDVELAKHVEVWPSGATSAVTTSWYKAGFWAGSSLFHGFLNWPSFTSGGSFEVRVLSGATDLAGNMLAPTTRTFDIVPVGSPSKSYSFDAEAAPVVWGNATHVVGPSQTYGGCDGSCMVLKYSFYLQSMIDAGIAGLIDPAGASSLRIRYRTEVWGNLDFTVMTVSSAGQVTSQVISQSASTLTLSAWKDLLMPLPSGSPVGFSISSGHFPDYPTFHDASKCWNLNTDGGVLYIDSIATE